MNILNAFLPPGLERSFICWFTPQIAKVTETGPSWIKESGASSKLPLWGQRPKDLGQPLLPSQTHEQRAALGVEQLELKSTDHIGCWHCRWLNWLCHNADSKRKAFWAKSLKSREANIFGKMRQVLNGRKEETIFFQWILSTMRKENTWLILQSSWLYQSVCMKN